MIDSELIFYIKCGILLIGLTAVCPSLASSELCSDSAVQRAVSQIKTIEKQTPPAVIRKVSDVPNFVHDLIYTLSVDTFGHITMALTRDFVMLGPSTDTQIVKFNPDLLDHFAKKARFPLQALQFVLAHEMAHRVQSVYFHHIDKQKSILGYEFDRSSKGIEGEISLHAETDCIALSLMKNARMKITFEQASEAQDLIRQECVEYRGPEFCQQAFEVRLDHVKKWMETNSYQFLLDP